MIEAIEGTIVRNNARDKAEREAKENSENNNKRKVEAAGQQNALMDENLADRDVRYRGTVIEVGLDGADEIHMEDMEGRIEPQVHENEKRKAEDSPRRAGPEEGNSKRSRAKAKAKAKAKVRSRGEEELPA
eukprot:15993703-Heterocapsa_arctica.AAC.1